MSSESIRLDEKRAALANTKPNSQGWRNKIEGMNGRDITLMYAEYKRDGKLVNNEVGS